MSDETPRKLAGLAQRALRMAGTTTTGRLVRERAARVTGTPSEPTVPPLSAAEVRAVLRDAWDGDPSDELDRFDPEPSVVTPTSQVHRGSLDGREMAVKVLRPGLTSRVRQDLALVETLAAALSGILPRIDATGLIREARDRALDEFDLEHEASATRRVHRALRRHPRFTVPAPEMSLAAERVLVTEWIDGVPFTEAPDPDRAAADLVSFVVGSLREGLVNGDPEPENLLITPDGRLAHLDFGSVRQVDNRRVDLVAAAVQAYAQDDAAALGAQLAALGVLPEETGADVLEVLRHALGPLGGAAPSRLDRDAVKAALGRLAEREDTVSELIAQASAPPEDLWPARALLQTFALIAHRGATAPWRSLIQAALRSGYAA